MKMKILKMVFISFMALVGFANAANAEPDYAPGELLVKFNPGVSPGAISHTLSSNSLTIHSSISGTDLYRVTLNNDSDVLGAVDSLKFHPDVIYAEPNYILYASRTPDDLYISYQWGIRNTGQSLFCDPCVGSQTGIAGKDINAFSGWDTTTGSSRVTIAIIDTGIDRDHPDLVGNISGGYNFITDNFFADDDNGHGTHVAGIAAAQGNNGIGVAGVCWSCKILPIKVLSADGSGLTSTVVSGILFAKDQGADIINLSLGGGASQSLKDAMQVVSEAGVISFCATGNDNSLVAYPAAYDEYCIAVGATDNKDTRATFSNKGAQIDVTAPGVDIYSTFLVGQGTINSSCYEDINNSGYGFCSGTSMATPFAAGLAGLILSQNPTYTSEQVLFRILQTAHDVNSDSEPGFDTNFGVGRISTDPGAIQTTSVSTDEGSGFCFISSFN